MSDWGGFLAGLGSMFVACVAVGKFVVSVIEKRNKAQIEEALDTFFFAKIRDYLQTAAENAGPVRTRVIDIRFINPDVLIRLPVIRDEWLTVLPGCEIMGDEYAYDYTTYLLRCSNTARIRRHTHEGAESVLVIKGTMKDTTTGKVYGPRETWEIPAGVVHGVQFESPPDNSSHGLFIITVRPPLPSSKQVLLQLDGLKTLAG